MTIYLNYLDIQIGYFETGLWGAHMKQRRQETTMLFIRKLVRNKKGATAIEYGLIAALIAVAAIAAMDALGTTLNNTFTTVEQSVKV